MINPTRELNRNATVTVGTSASVVSEITLPGQRKIISIINTSTAGQVISLGFGNIEAAAGNGVQLSPGGYYIESLEAGFVPTQDRISAISDIAGGTLAIMERVVNN
jgi:hypothetical protein